jgi:hypothetical protein
MERDNTWAYSTGRMHYAVGIDTKLYSRPHQSRIVATCIPHWIHRTNNSGERQDESKHMSPAACRGPDGNVNRRDCRLFVTVSAQFDDEVFGLHVTSSALSAAAGIGGRIGRGVVESPERIAEASRHSCMASRIDGQGTR